jgi:hypothetical protein
LQGNVYSADIDYFLPAYSVTFLHISGSQI